MPEIKKVLLTGADGFIGSHLTEYLLSKGYEVRALSYYNSFNYWGWLEDIPANNKLEIVAGDIRDPFFCNEICKGMDAVLHLAALIAIPFSYKAPQSYIDTNINGTQNICQAAMTHSLKKVIVTSTSEVYGSAMYVPIDEKHPLQPQSPYSASKIGADAMAMSYYYSFDLPLVLARPFNTYGPRQSARAVIPNMIIQMLNGKDVMIGDLTPTRDFNYVKDVCKGFTALLENDVSLGEVYNIGSNFEISIQGVFDTLKEIIQTNVNLIQDPNRFRPQKSEVNRLWCDNAKIKKECGYSPDYTFKLGLEETVKWFGLKENISKYKDGIYNV